MDKDNSLQFYSNIAIENFFWDKMNKQPENKLKMCKHNIKMMLRRTASMFKWKGLPDTIPAWLWELNIQTCGFMGLIKEKDEFYGVYGGLGSVPNYNYMPTTLIVANPYLKLNKSYDIYDTDNSKANVVIFPNDMLYEGLLPMLSYHSQLITEINLTKKIVIVNHRLPMLVTASDNNAKRDIDGLYEDLEAGKIYSIFDRSFLKDIQSIPLNDNATRGILTQILELEQYQTAKMFNDLGMSMNYNMKRETITSSESQLGEDALFPLPDNMLAMRRESCKRAKDIFDIDLEVDFSSSWWEENKKQMLTILKEIKDVQSSIKSTEQDNSENEEVQSTEQDNSENEEVQSTEQDNSENEEVQSTEQDNSENEVIINSIVEDVLEEIVEDLSIGGVGDETKETT